MGSKIVMGATGLMPVFQYILYESRRNGIVMRLVITDRCKVMDSKGVLGTYTMPRRKKRKDLDSLIPDARIAFPLGGPGIGRPFLAWGLQLMESLPSPSTG